MLADQLLQPHFGAETWTLLLLLQMTRTLVRKVLKRPELINQNASQADKGAQRIRKHLASLIISSTVARVCVRESAHHTPLDYQA